MAPPRTDELILATVDNFHRASGFPCQKGCAKIKRKSPVRFAPEASTDKGKDYAHPGFRDPQQAGHITLHHVRHLGAGPQSVIPRIVVPGNADVRFQRDMRTRRRVKYILPDMTGPAESFFQVPVGQNDLPADIARHVFVYQGSSRFHCLLGSKERFQFLPFKYDLVKSFVGSILIYGSHGSYGIANISHFVFSQGDEVECLLPMPRWTTPQSKRILAGNYRLYSANPPAFGGVNVQDAGMGQPTVEYLAIEHAGH